MPNKVVEVVVNDGAVVGGDFTADVVHGVKVVDGNDVGDKKPCTRLAVKANQESRSSLMITLAKSEEARKEVTEGNRLANHLKVAKRLSTQGTLATGA